MTPAARVQAAIDCLDAIIAAARDQGAAADTLIARYFAARRYAGSKDRRAVRELVYNVIRALGERPPSGRAALIGYARAQDPALLDLFGTGGPHAPAAIAADEAVAEPGLAPGWLLGRLRRRFGGDTMAEAAALLGRAPLYLRANRLRTSRDALLAQIPGAAPCRFAPDGLRAPDGFAADADAGFAAGAFEVQDEGSQLAALACGAAPGMTVVDLCAGAGGKTLALAAAMANRGRIIACDTDRGRLGRLAPRAARAGVTIAATRLLDPGREEAALGDLMGAADLVLIDAPCSGSGTWRRNPEARWRLTPARLARLVAEQARLLILGATLVRPGGVLTYVVCSLLPEEGEGQLAALDSMPGWAPAPFALPGLGPPVASLVLTPQGHGCDGFFIARQSRLC